MANEKTGQFVMRSISGSRRTGAIVATAVMLASLGLTPGAARAQVQTYTCTAPGGFGVGVPAIAPIPMASLKTVPNPVLPNGPAGPPRDDLVEFIWNQPVAIQLGKALFWEMQAGSDNQTACATCHFQAGADTRTRNQLNPGFNTAWDGYGVNRLLTLLDFPFALGQPATRNIDNVAGSQGVRASRFAGFAQGTGAETVTPVADPTFGTFRQVTGKNTPPAVNAVFNHRNFWNGRAQAEFNGVSPWGIRDASARVLKVGLNGTPAPIDIHIQNASLASQAVGPPLNPVEMSAAGRTFPDLGRKLLSAKPLALQKVDPTDSVLGALADTATGKGLNTSYTVLIQRAFQPKWWKTRGTTPPASYSMMESNFSLYWGLAIMLYEATLVSDNSPMDQYLMSRVFMIDPVTKLPVTNPVTGLPILLADNPALLDPVVARLAADAAGAGIQLTRQDILNGLALFERPAPPAPSFPVTNPNFGVGCIGCHLGAETTSASVRNLTGPGLEPGDAAFKKAGFDLRMERMFINADWPATGPLTVVPLGISPTSGATFGPNVITFDPALYAVNVQSMFITPTGVTLPLSLPVRTYDAGWYNIGVRPTLEDAGLGGVDAFAKPLSWTELFQTSGIPVEIPGNGLPCAGINLGTPFPNEVLNPRGFPLLSGSLTRTEATDVAGSFKVPALRNVELNGPYFHTGGMSTLAQVIDFYDEGGSFGRTTNPTKAPAIVPLRLTPDQRKSLLAFLLALTDDRVRLEQAPFDHPELVVPNGANPDGTDINLPVPAVGRGGSATPLQRFLALNPFRVN